MLKKLVFFITLIAALPAICAATNNFYWRDVVWDDGRIMTSNFDGSNQEVLISDSYNTYSHPKFSHDRTHLAFLKTTSSGNQQICVMMSPSDIKCVDASGYTYGFGWGADGHTIYYCKNEGDGEIWKIDFSEMNPVARLFLDPPVYRSFGLDISNDGKRMIVIHDPNNSTYGNYIQSYDFSSGNTVTILANDGFRDFFPDHSPTRDEVVWGKSEGGQDKMDVWIMNSDGANARNLTPSTSDSHQQLPRFSFNGEEVFYNENNYLWVIKRDGSDKKRLFYMGAGSTHYFDVSNNYFTDSALEQAILLLNPTNREVPGQAGTTSFEVSNTGTGTMAWTATVTSTGNWLNITSGASGSNTGTINCSYDANSSSFARTGTIRIISAGATGSPMDITVSQAAAPAQCSYSISPSSSSYSNTGGSNSVSVTASSSSCAWTTSGSLPWVSISPSSGTGNGVVTLNVAANTEAARSGSVTIAGITYTMNQDAGNERGYLSVNRSSLKIPMLNTDKFKISGGTSFYQVSSSDESVATYSITGNTVTVKGKAIGTAQIIITDSSGSRVIVNVLVTQKVKAIIVAGSGPFTGNHLWESTLSCTQNAYKVLQHQGYTDETIKFLASDTRLDINGDGINEVGGDATVINLKDAITNWAPDAKDVIIYMTGHGSEGKFRIGENELLDARELNNWFNTLERTISGNLTFIYDACQSGSFLRYLTSATGKERINIASASLGQEATFVSFGAISFSNLFWTQIGNGGNIKDSFIIAQNAIEYTYDQTPVLDDSGNGIGNEDEDGTVSEDAKIGNGRVTAADIPTIQTVSQDITLNGETSAVFFADNVTDSDGIQKVWAIITPPGVTMADPDVPVLFLPTVEMSLTGRTKYGGIYSDFGSIGTYNIVIYAKDTEGNISLPRRIKVTQNSEGCRVNIAGHTVSGTQTVNSPVSFTVNANSSCSNTLYYRFSVHPDYGTSGYDGLHWRPITATEYQTANNCTYSFRSPGKYIVVVWVVTDPNSVSAAGIPITGWSVDISEDACKTVFTGSNFSGTKEVNAPVTFTVNTQNSCSSNLYYRFSMHPYYGTDGYNGLKWTSMTAIQWVTTNSIDYTFTQKGKYIVVVWGTKDPNNYDPNGIPIIGWSVDIK